MSTETAPPASHATRGGSTFEVDKQGLAKLLERRGKEFAVTELIQNAWDEDGVTTVEVTLERVDPTRTGKHPHYVLQVTDDAPEGFSDLRHAYTLFAESKKKDRADQRGRFNLGEKLVIALCDRAEVKTTKGRIEFNDHGRQEYDGEDDRTDAGSIFTGNLRLTAEEYEAVEGAVNALIVPEGITTTFNGAQIQPRTPLKTFQVTLRTELADGEGYLRPTRRKTTVNVYEPLPGETASIYEMGIPVVETGDSWHVDIGQKVPLTTDRDNVPPGWLRDVRAAVLNHCSGLLLPEQAQAKWVDDALEDEAVEPEAVKAAVVGRYGSEAVIEDPTDREGTKIAMSKGMTVIPSGAFSKDAWKNVKGAAVVLPAGQVTPSPKPDGDKDLEMAMEHWPEPVTHIARYANELAQELLGCPITVRVVNAPQATYLATYGKGALTLNYGRLGYSWFKNGRCEKVDDLLLHEFAHHKVTDHLSNRYHEECTRLGAKMVQLALDKPKLLRTYEA